MTEEMTMKKKNKMTTKGNTTLRLQEEFWKIDTSAPAKKRKIRLQSLL